MSKVILQLNSMETLISISGDRDLYFSCLKVFEYQQPIGYIFHVFAPATAPFDFYIYSAYLDKEHMPAGVPVITIARNHFRSYQDESVDGPRLFAASLYGVDLPKRMDADQLPADWIAAISKGQEVAS